MYSNAFEKRWQYFRHWVPVRKKIIKVLVFMRLEKIISMNKFAG